MKNSNKGLHHITVLGGDGQRTTDFYVKALGLRMVLKTVNQDDPSTYHLFFGNGTFQQGSSITFFPWPMAVQGKPGTGETTVVSFAVPENSLLYWAERFGQLGVDFTGPFTRFGKQVIGFQDPDRLNLELVFDEAVHSIPAWEDSTVPEEHGIRGFWGTTLKLSETKGTGEILDSVLGFQKKASEGNLELWSTGAPVGGSVIIEKTDHKPGVTGRGTVHHVAFRAKDDEEQEMMRRQIIEEYLSPSPVIDRHVFKSVYFQSPGGVLFEIATDGPGYRSAQSEEELGKKVFLPSWLESRRDMIEKRLPEIVV
ncbi:MAG: ring-cleaving dioxygenase [Balneolaceae bacterium]|nr:MAG: ring-cleaving dioxygenase [Balneolaceae bacterium]